MLTTAVHPEQALAKVQVFSERDREQHAKLCHLGTPGTRLWVLPVYDNDGYAGKGLGSAATSLGLSLNLVEGLLGYGPGSLLAWNVCWRADDGEEDTGRVVALEDARRAWWITDGNGDLVAGGPPIYDADRAAEIAAEYNGNAQLGLGSYDPDA
jgi:hypothetical protein